jgi:hypothetical protein
MKRDMHRRERLARKDDNTRKRHVEIARRLIFEKGLRPGSKKISNIIGAHSLTPNRVRVCFSLFLWNPNTDYHCQNAFSERLGPHGVDYHALFVVDLLHEFELGVWKATFTHLIRILYAYGGDTVTLLNERYFYYSMKCIYTITDYE